MNTPYASASLYVGDLPSDVTEGMLFEIFNQVGPVASIRVCRDAVTRRSLGYAYVNYHNVVDAERALDTLNSSLIKAKPCRVMWSQRDPSLRKSGVGNIFIKNLDKTIDHKALYDTFSAFGNILSCKVVTDDQNQSKGYGFVHFETKEAAEKAISKVNGMMLNNQKVFVGPFVTRKERLKTQDGEQKFTNVYVKNLDETVTTDKLREVFSEFGTITNAAIMNDDNGSKSKGFGFVNFETAESAKKAVEALNSKDNTSLPHVKDKPLYVGRAQKKSERENELRAKFEALKLERLNKYQGVNLYVKNLEDNIDDEKLRAEFAPYGTITSCKVMRDDKINSKGFGFVCYSTPEEATRSVTEMNGRILGTKPLYVALAQRRDVRKAQLEAQHAQRAKMRQNAPAMGPMYPPGAPVFYPQPPGGIPQPGGFVGYPQQMMPRNNWRGQPQPGGYQVPHYVVNTVAQRPQHPSQRPPRGAAGQQGGIVGGAKDQRGAQNGRRGGRNPNPNPRPDIPQQAPQLQPELIQPQAQAPAMPDINTPLTPALLAQYPVEQQKNMVGERIYPLIEKLQPAWAGKITGMLLDSFYTEEMLTLIDSSDALLAKVQEAVEVLKANEFQGGQ
jgi:polyadenylate-binding protein